MEKIKDFYNKIISDWIEKAHVNDWQILEEVLQYCKSVPDQVLFSVGFILLTTILMMFPYSRFRRLFLWIMLKFAPSQIELIRVNIKQNLNHPSNQSYNPTEGQSPHLQQAKHQTNQSPKFAEPYKQKLYEILTPQQSGGFSQEIQSCDTNELDSNRAKSNSFEDSFDDRFHSDEFDLINRLGMYQQEYRHMCIQFEGFGFQMGSIYHHKMFGNDVYLTPFFKQGVCAFITHNLGTCKFSMIAIMDNARQVLNLSTEPMDKHIPRPDNYKAILMDKHSTVKDGMAEFVNEFNVHPHKNQLTHLNDDNFAEYYERFHEEFFAFLKSLSIFELKGDS